MRSAHEMTRTEREAEVERLKRDHAVALGADLLSEGTISAQQVAAMSRHTRKVYDARVRESFDVRARIRDLERTDEQIAEERRKEAEETREKEILRLTRSIETWTTLVPSGKNGKPKPKYQKLIDAAKARLAVLGVTL